MFFSRSKKSFSSEVPAIRYFALLAGVGAALAFSSAPAFAADSHPSTVANKVYAVNVQTSFGTTFTDCFRFTDTIMSIDGCGDSGPYSEQALFGSTYGTGWGGHVPCTGLDLAWFGTAIDGATFPSGQGADTIAGVALGKSQGTTFSVSGIASPTCPNSSARGGVNWTKPE